MFGLWEREQSPTLEEENTPSPAQQLRMYLGACNKRPDSRKDRWGSHWLQREIILIRTKKGEDAGSHGRDTPSDYWRDLVKCFANGLVQEILNK